MTSLFMGLISSRDSSLVLVFFKAYSADVQFFFVQIVFSLSKASRSPSEFWLQSRNLQGEPISHLLIFGDPEEDTDYAAKLELLARDMELTDDIRFLGGVPLCSGLKETKAMLNEKDLLRLAAATHGGVVYTPDTADVESVGLGPALASIAGIPCLVSKFNALDQVYGNGLNVIRLDPSRQNGFEIAAESFVEWMVASSKESMPESQQRAWSEVMQQNKSLMEKKFSVRAWKDLLLRLASEGGVSGDLISNAQEALGMIERISPRM
ncbi:hypothetical protein BKA64DRAFT_646803 [Cadophora sp. MPI-SDFR-AT-0126]|nr:hypothetical protein BKA64DRAFT_646803 [Leotiomycetes sp. MPI-SDFR-AT-0126]